MMKALERILVLVLALMLACPAALAAATPTPPPVDISALDPSVPEQVQTMLDIAYGEWETLAGKALPRVNKYTEWRGKGIGFGWCGGYITWCMMEADVPMMTLESIKAAAKKSGSGLFEPDGVYHCKEASVGKLLRAYQLMGRSTNIPRPGFLLVYGASYSKTIHIGLVYDVQDLGGGKYRITTLEGNMSSRVKMYVRDYDMNVKVNTNSRTSTNLTAIPESDYPLPESDHVSYDIPTSRISKNSKTFYPYYVNCFLMPWMPGDVQPTAAPTPAPTAEPTIAPTPAPTAEPTPVPTATPTLPMTPTPAPAATPVPTEAPAAVLPTPEAPQATEVPAEPEATVAPARPTFPCQGRNGQCTYTTAHENDPFCRMCDFNDNGVEDTKE